MKFVLVARDIGSANVTSRVAHSLLGRGHQVYAVTEGKATGIFLNSGIHPIVALPEVITQNSIDFGDLFDTFCPDGVVTGLSSPINLENTAGQVANAKHIPLAIIEDGHGVSKRTGAHPNLVCAVDEIGVAESEKNHPDAKVIKAGNIGVKDISPSEEMKKCVTYLRSKYDALFVFTESGKPNNSAVDEQIDLLIKCVRMSTGKICIIPRLHPKWANVIKEGMSLHARWMGKLLSGIPTLEEVSTGNTDELVALADGTVSVLSTLLTTSASCGKQAISLRTPRSTRFMQEIMGFSTLPLVSLGCAAEIGEPTDLLQVLRKQSQKANLWKLTPFNPEIVYEALTH